MNFQSSKKKPRRYFIDLDRSSIHLSREYTNQNVFSYTLMTTTYMRRYFESVVFEM